LSLEEKEKGEKITKYQDTSTKEQAPRNKHQGTSTKWNACEVSLKLKSQRSKPKL
jgi:hypothetical protein